MIIPRVILASTSPRRRELLSKLLDGFEIVDPVGVDENAARGAASEIAGELAARKADSVIEHRALRGVEEVEGTLVLGADTVVAARVPGGSGGMEVVLGKPIDRDDARRMLRLLSGRSHSVWTGVAVARHGFATSRAVERTEVTFKQLSDSEIDAYIASGDWQGKAGAYGIQSQGSALVESFQGCYYNVVGLPLQLASTLLRAAGARIPPHECDCFNLPLQRLSTGASPRTSRCGCGRC